MWRHASVDAIREASPGLARRVGEILSTDDAVADKEIRRAALAAFSWIRSEADVWRQKIVSNPASIPWPRTHSETLSVIS